MLLVPAPQKQEVNGGVFNFLFRSWQQFVWHNLRKIGLFVSVNIINNICKLIVCLFNSVFGCEASKTRQLLFSLLCCLSPLFVIGQFTVIFIRDHSKYSSRLFCQLRIVILSTIYQLGFKSMTCQQKMWALFDGYSPSKQVISIPRCFQASAIQPSLQ